MKKVQDILNMTDPKQVQYYLDYYIMIEQVLHKRGINNPKHTKDTELIKKHLEQLRLSNPNNVSY